MKTPEWSPRIVFAVGFSIITYGFWQILRPSIHALIWAAVLATVCYPLYTALARKLGGRRRLSSVLACVLISLLIVVPAIILVIVLAKQSVDASYSVQQLLHSPDFDQKLQATHLRFNEQVSRMFGGAVDVSGIDVRAVLMEMLRRMSEFLLSASRGLATGFAGFVINFFIMVAALYFFFVDGRRLAAELQKLIPLPARHGHAILRQFKEVSEATLLGTLLTGVSQGAVGWLIFVGLGLPSPFFWGSIMAIAAFIPLVGAGLIWIPAAAYFFLTGQAVKGIILVVLGIGVIGSIDNLVKVFVLKDRMRLHTLLLFLSILGGIKVFGLIGLILGPLIAALFVTFLSIYKAEFRYKAE
jgi:predicted PurR-regulated permease PerM